MEDEYGMTDLRQYITGRPYYPAVTRPPEFFSGHRGLISPQPYDMLMFGSDYSTVVAPNIVTTAPNYTGVGASSAAAGGGLIGGGDGGTARWPRQETLSLLEIRSRLDPKFKEANQKGPLWDEVSRIMSEEYGYQRSGKKCREKFENLYKYYKKTKEGKSARRHGKHYRFFRQLEALYGTDQTATNSASMSETHSVLGGNFQYNYHETDPGPVLKLSDTSLISLSNSFDDESDKSSSDDESDINVGTNSNNGLKMKKRRGKRGIRAKIRDSIDAQMRKLMEKQEAWMEKMMNTIEHKDQERMLREEQWRKQDAERIENEHKFWASERAWMEARDAALMEAFQKLAAGKESRNLRGNNHGNDDTWQECEITRLIQLRNGMESKFQQGGISEEILWEEIASKMGCFGHDRNGSMCKHKWNCIVNDYVMKCNNKKRRESSIRSCTYYQNHHEESICNIGGGVGVADEHRVRFNNDHGILPRNSNNNAGNAIYDSCFRYFMD